MGATGPTVAGLSLLDIIANWRDVSREPFDLRIRVCVFLLLLLLFFFFFGGVSFFFFSLSPSLSLNPMMINKMTSLSYYSIIHALS